MNPKTQAIERWAKDTGLSGDINSLCENPKVKDYILEQLTKLGKEKKVVSVYFGLLLPVSVIKNFSFYFIFLQLKGFEIIKNIHLDPVPFDINRDLITPTYKKKRPQMLKYYQVPSLTDHSIHFIFVKINIMYYYQAILQFIHKN